MTDTDKRRLLNNALVIDLLLEITEIDNSDAKVNFVYNAMNETDPDKIRELNQMIMAMAKEIELFKKNIETLSRSDYLKYMKNECIKNGFDRELMEWTWHD